MTGTRLARLIDDVIARAAAARWDLLSEPTRDAALRLVMDCLGVAAGGIAAPGIADSVRAYEQLAGPGTITVPWRSARMPAADAAMVLSLLIHGWDFDDTHDIAVVHAGSVVLPAALAAAQHVGAAGQRILEGVVAGVEVLSGLALAVGEQPGVIRTAGLGAFGAAAAVGRVLGLDGAAMHNALSLCLSIAMSPGSRQAVEDGAISKRHQPGFACRHGLTAAFLAQAGIAGPQGWFSGSWGIGANISDEAASLSRVAAATDWQVAHLSLKPYPACRYTHAAIAGTLRLVHGAPGREDIARLTVHVPVGNAHLLVARPWATYGERVVDAQFSIPWLCAAVLHLGRFGLDTLTGGDLLDAAIERRAADIDVIQDQHTQHSVMTPVRVAAERIDGSVETVDVNEVPGDPGSPLSWTDLARKAEGCLNAVGADPGTAAALEHIVRTLPETGAADVAALTLLAG